MSVKRYAKQLRRKQARQRRATQLAFKRLDNAVPFMDWLANQRAPRRPDRATDAVWQVVMQNMPIRKFGKLAQRARAKTLGISTRSY